MKKKTTMAPKDEIGNLFIGNKDTINSISNIYISMVKEKILVGL